MIGDMFDFKKHDFSKESKIKDKLFEKMKLVYEKSKSKATMLSEDDLDLVSAAARIHSDIPCPYPDRSCYECENYIHIQNQCKHCYKK